MDNIIYNSYSQIPILNVSRETCNELESLISMIQEKNKEINIISKKMFEKEQIRERHIIDSAQIIDFVDLNYNTTSDLGTGGGMPGLKNRWNHSCSRIYFVVTRQKKVY